MAVAPEFVIACGVRQRFGNQLQRWRRLKSFRSPGFFQSAEAVQDVLFGGLPSFQGLGDSPLYLLLIMEQHQGEDVDHLPIAARALQQPCA
jgi:hypothetical protein